jgi:quinol monooxygenase YgiN
MIAVIAKIKAKPGKESELEAAFREQVANVASEEGTLMYTLHRSQSDPTVFLFYEQYKDSAALKLHSATPYFKALFQTIQPLVAGPPDIEKFDGIVGLER